MTDKKAVSKADNTKAEVSISDTSIPAVFSSNDGVPAGYIGISSKFAELQKLITRDLNNYRNSPTFFIYNKDEIKKYLANPYRYEKELRKAIIYIYGASTHFRRLIQYFAGLTDWVYVVEPFNIDPKKANQRTINNNYRKVLNILTAMNIPTQFAKILTVCLREDTYYGVFRLSNNNITIQQLPSDYCAISSMEGNVFNVTFNFSYFDSHQELLANYPKEFEQKYNIYKKKRTNRWIELDAPTSFAIKCNNDIVDYPLPPFAGLLRPLYDIEDYVQLKSAKTRLENYAMLAMTLPLDKDGQWGINLEKARDFWRNLDAVLPEEIGSVLTPMPITKIDFEKSNTGDTDTVSEAEKHMFTAAGVSSLLFNNDKASANALLLSIKADQMVTFAIVRSIQDALNRLIQAQSFGKNFMVNFLDVSPYTRKEMGDMYLKSASYGLPTICAYAASQGLGQAELDAMSFLEGTVLGLPGMFKPIVSSTQLSSSDLESKGATDEGGAPKKEIGELTDSGEQSSENKDDWG